MKRRVWSVVVVVIIMVGIYVAVIHKRPIDFTKVEIEKIVLFDGNASSGVTFTIEKDDSQEGKTRRVEYKRNRGVVKHTKKVYLTQEEYEVLLLLLNEQKAYQWKGFNKHEKVEGGNGFKVELIEPDKDMLLFAAGTNYYPKGYEEFKEKAYSYLEGFFV